MKYPEKESATLEFKSTLPTKQQIVKTIIGFCNLFGGKLILGVDDDGTIIGVPEDTLDDMITALHKSIYESCTPHILPMIHSQRIQDKIILMIEVSAGMNKPYFLTSLGLEEGCFVRVGIQTVKATASMIKELQWQSLGKEPDEMPIYSATEEAIDEKLFEEFLSRRDIKFPKWREQALHYGLLIEEHKRIFPTYAGMLLFGKTPQRFLSESFVICSHFSGTNGREALATFDASGTLFSQHNDAMAFVTSRLYKSFTIKGVGPRQETLEIPPEALREVILNALVHRDYYIRAPSRIFIYDDRVEVFSPGNFPGPLKADQLEMGFTFVRNAVIGRVFREAKLIEKLGSGLRTLFTSYREQGLPAPHIIEGNGFVKAILPRRGLGNKIYPQEEAFSELDRLLHVADEVSTGDVARELNLSKTTAKRMISRWVAEGKIVRIGHGPATRYRLMKGVRPHT